MVSRTPISEKLISKGRPPKSWLSPFFIFGARYKENFFVLPLHCCWINKKQLRSVLFCLVLVCSVLISFFLDMILLWKDDWEKGEGASIHENLQEFWYCQIFLQKFWKWINEEICKCRNTTTARNSGAFCKNSAYFSWEIQMFDASFASILGGSFMQRTETKEDSPHKQESKTVGRIDKSKKWWDLNIFEKQVYSFSHVLLITASLKAVSFFNGFKKWPRKKLKRLFDDFQNLFS